MTASRGAAKDSAAAARTRGSRTGARPAIVLTCVALLAFLLVPLVAGAAPDQPLVPTGTDLPATAAPSVVPSPDVPLKVPEQVDDVVNGITAPPPSPPPESGGEPGEEPPGGGGDGGGGGGDTPKPGGGPGGGPSAPVTTDPVQTVTTGRELGPRETDITGAVPQLVWRGAAPSLATLATRARSLVAPLAAPMGLGLIAVMLLGLASRGPGVITKLNEELESADGRQVWRL